MGASEQSGNGGLSKDQAAEYIANFAMVDKNGDGQISEAEFQAGCESGWVQTASRTGDQNSGSKTDTNPSQPY
jgi:hypothetical protein